MNKDTIEGNWKEIKGKAKQKWAMLGDDDYALLAEGKFDQLAGLIQKAKGITKEQAQKEIDEFNQSCGCSSSNAA